MGVDRPSKIPTRPVDQLLVFGREAGRVDDRCGAVTDVDHVRRMAKTLVDELVHVHPDLHHILKEPLEYSRDRG